MSDFSPIKNSSTPARVRRRCIGGSTAMLFASMAMLFANLAMPALATERLPIMVPLTSYIALEGTSQRNGALLSLQQHRGALDIKARLFDTASSPQKAAQAFARALLRGGTKPVASFGPIDGNSMLAQLPLAKRIGVPLLTVSGTAKLSDQNNPFFFRFFPSDHVVKIAQARYAVRELGHRHIAIIAQTTAYGQSGLTILRQTIAALGARVAFSDQIPVTTREMAPIIARVRRSGATAILLQLHAGSTALFIQQARNARLDLPIVAGSAMHQPSTAALIDPAALRNVCAETAAIPSADPDPAMQAFRRAYLQAYGTEPDAFAVGMYDAMAMVLRLRQSGIKDPAAMRAALARQSYKGLAMTYRSDGKGNMAHDAMIICYDGKSRTPAIVKRYPAILQRPRQ